MREEREVKLAQLIVLLDVLRDELYEELMQALGKQAPELLRAVQNKFN